MELVEIVKLVADVGFPILCAAVIIYLFIKYHTNNEKRFDELLKRTSHPVSPLHPSTSDIEALEIINNKLHQELEGIMRSIKTDRAYIVLYHNGGVSMSGLSFQKMSCICESVSEGILPMMDSIQNIHRASYSLLCDNLKEQGSVEFTYIKDLQGQDNFLYQEMLRRHVVSAYFRALKDIKGMVVGYLGVEYCSINEEFSDEEIRKLLKNVGLRISSLVDIRDEVQ